MGKSEEELLVIEVMRCFPHPLYSSAWRQAFAAVLALSGALSNIYLNCHQGATAVSVVTFSWLKSPQIWGRVGGGGICSSDSADMKLKRLIEANRFYNKGLHGASFFSDQPGGDIASFQFCWCQNSPAGVKSKPVTILGSSSSMLCGLTTPAHVDTVKSTREMVVWWHSFGPWGSILVDGESSLWLLISGFYVVWLVEMQKHTCTTLHGHRNPWRVDMVRLESGRLGLEDWGKAFGLTLQSPVA
ncbi:hypothetical protein Ancab_032384 [Ancistrocladus abbreviatus]